MRKWIPVLLGLVILLALSPVKGSVRVESVTGAHIYVPTGTPVTVYVKLASVGGYAQGVLTVKVRKDIVWGADQDYVTLSKTVYIPPNSEKVVRVGTFTPRDKTCDSPGCVREYFIEIYWNGKRVDSWQGFNPSNPDVRPWVKTY